MSRPRLLLVTGKLAEPSLRRVLSEPGLHARYEFQIAVLPISVAALATTTWIARHLAVPPGVDRLVLPGVCPGDLSALQSLTSATIERGPEDLLDLPEYLGSPRQAETLTEFDIHILAEINGVQRLPLAEILAVAHRYRADGADFIDLGCDPGDPWTAARETVRTLREEGFRVSIDSFDHREVQEAVAGGAELVLSVNQSNREQARSWSCEVVAVPDEPGDLPSLERTIDCLEGAGVAYRIDPILTPIGFGFAASLHAYWQARQRFPRAEFLMGVGNLTELTGVDSAGINLVLAGFCQELGIRSVLTTEVANWCRTSVRELDLARRLVFQACRQRMAPKNLSAELIALRDPKVHVRGEQALRELAEHLTDANFRIFAERGQLHLMNRRMYLEGGDPFAVFAEARKTQSVDPAHAFYLGFEMALAQTALTLGKNYTQDRPLRWGFLGPGERRMPAASEQAPGSSVVPPA